MRTPILVHMTQTNAIDSWYEAQEATSGVRDRFLLLGELCRALLPAGALDDLEIPHVTGAIEANLEEVKDQIRCRPSALGDSYQTVASRIDRHPNGEFFTPEPIARFMADLVSAHNPRTVLDPAVGAGVLLAKLAPHTEVYGTDINPLCVALSRATLETVGLSHRIEVGDFLATAVGGKTPFPEIEFDAIVSNPPYIRHHLLGDAKNQYARHYDREFGVRLSRLSSGYVYFMLEAIRRLRPGGTMVFITPTEYLDTVYGRAVKKALLSATRIDDIFLFDQSESEFGATLTTSCITVASLSKPGNVRLHCAKTVGADVKSEQDSAEPQAKFDSSEKWSFLFGERGTDYRSAVEKAEVRLHDVARVRRGIATGNNSFFLLSEADVQSWGIEREFVVPAVGSARMLKSATLDDSMLTTIRDRGERCWLLWCHSEREELEGTNVLKYIEHGEATGVAERYLCKARKPWWSVEKVPAPDIIATYMNRSGVRFIRNLAGVRVMSTFLNIYAGSWDSERLIAALQSEGTTGALRSVSRVYGGGLSKIEPGDLAALPLVE